MADRLALVDGTSLIQQTDGSGHVLLAVQSPPTGVGTAATCAAGHRELAVAGATTREG